MKIWRSMFDDSCREKILNRIRSLNPQAKARWGKMDAPRMIAHLTDQMHHVLGDSAPRPRRGVLRWPPVRYASIYLAAWPKGRIKGPAEAFVTKPTSWEADVKELERLIGRFAARSQETDWPEHALFGPMSRRDWGVFCHKHFDYHLRQFGA